MLASKSGVCDRHTEMPHVLDVVVVLALVVLAIILGAHLIGVV
jgi:hypothetical protein